MRPPGGTPMRDQQGARDLAERHAERAVDHLRGEADQDEGQEDGRDQPAIPWKCALSTLLVGASTAADAAARQAVRRGYRAIRLFNYGR